ncbi:hypothetical protein K3495_g15125, partial [Podosphaera aphanis]
SHGYTACEEISDSSSHEYTSDDSSEDGPVSDSDFPQPQKVMLTKELISKSTPAAWVLDTGATSPMTDQIHLFRGKLKKIHPTTIQVGGGTLISSHRGTVVVKCADGSSGIAENVFYVPNLGVNLLSAKRLCRTGMKGHFDEKNVWIMDENKIMIHAVQTDGLYIVKHIATELRGKPLDTRVIKQMACSATDGAVENKSLATKLKIGLRDYHDTSRKCSDNPDLSDKDPDKSDDDLAETKEERARYRLIHRRFGHYGPNIIGKLHKTSNIDRVKIPIAEKRICKSCKIGKMKNKICNTLAQHKTEPLELISFDVAGPFPKSLRGNRYFLQVIDNWTRRTWSIPMKTKDQAISELRKLRVREERQTGRKLKSTRSDNAPELKHVMLQWEREDGVVANFTAIASSHQNGPAERSIQTAEMAIRTMIDDAELPIEFWDEAVEYDSYIRNRLPLGPIIDGQLTSPLEAYTGVRPNVEHIRPWGYKAYGYVNPKTLEAKGRHDKLVVRGREGVFMGFSENTEKHTKIYAPDLGRVERVNAVLIDEKVKGGMIDLRLKESIITSQGTPNRLPLRKKRGRSSKEEDIQQTKVYE